MNDWFKSFLQNRRQYTVVNGVKSAIGNIVCGVPQGSVLGPLLFLIYVNDITSELEDNKLKLFADDTNLFLSGRCVNELESKANACLTKMHDWFLANKLSLNIDKTCYILFSNRQSGPCGLQLKFIYK